MRLVGRGCALLLAALPLIQAQPETAVLVTLAGSTSVNGAPARGFAGDNGPARRALFALANLQNECDPARFEQISHIAVDTSGNLYIADSANHRIRRVTPRGVVTTVAGNGERPPVNPVNCVPTGGAACRNLPADPQRLLDFLFETKFWFEGRGASWTSASFEPASLIGDFVDYLPTLLDRPWTCGVASSPQPGMGEALILWMTGDPTGFGSLRAEQVANAAGGPSGPVAPGELLAIYAEQLGPAPDVFSRLDGNGRVPTSLGGTEVLFDGTPAPILYASQFQINVQVPYTLRPGADTVVQAFFRGMPSNRVSIPVAESSPEIFYDVATRSVVALNEDGTRNGPADRAASGSIVILFASGGGQTSPPGVAGMPAPSPHPVLTNPASVTVEGRPAEILFAGEVPGFTGLVQVNARLPLGLTPGARPIALQIGSRASRAPVLLWVR